MMELELEPRQFHSRLLCFGVEDKLTHLGRFHTFCFCIMISLSSSLHMILKFCLQTKSIQKVQIEIFAIGITDYQKHNEPYYHKISKYSKSK